MFKELKEINSRPTPFQFYTADELWTNEHTSMKMLEYHLNESVDLIAYSGQSTHPFRRESPTPSPERSDEILF